MSEEENIKNLPNFIALEERILKKWDEMDIFNYIQSQTKENPPFIFLEGPPTANGMPHIGHILTRVLKDLYLRYKSMCGFFVTPRIGGWDCHGLPVEIEIEKKLGFTEKEQIEEYGIGKFNDLCRESVFKYVNEWIKMSIRVGFLLDMPIEKAYVTMDRNYIESIWWSLKTLYDKKMLVKGFKIVPLCPRCGTPLSSHEVAQGYQENTEDPSVFVKFPLLNHEKRFFIVWTTTPWTLISNLLLALKADADYVLFEYDNEEYIMAQSLIKSVFGKKKIKIIKKYLGKNLAGIDYEPIFDYTATAKGKKHFTVVADFVTMDEGTGIVHIAPGFGADDYEICQSIGVPVFNPVEQNGRFIDEVPIFGGNFVKDADPAIIEDLKSRNRLLYATTIKHTYPFCWRCNSPIIYYAMESWFIKMSNLRRNLWENNQQVNWQPSFLKNGRFGNFIKEAKDWSLSRNRYWGTPLNIWNCPKGHQFAIGSVEELQKLSDAPDDIDLHKPMVDQIEVFCPECKALSTREEYVIDCWYDSGAAFFAQWHYPFENKELFSRHFPVDFITEALDQTRGWFYTLLAISTVLFNKPAYLNCLTMGLILDEDGVKMSKSKGNAISPDEAINLFGADAARWYLCSNAPWRSARFGINSVRETGRAMQLLLWNTYSFYKNYAEIDYKIISSSSKIPLNERPILDQYILSIMNRLIQSVRDSMDSFENHRAINAIRTFLNDDLSNWWIRRSRRRFWEPEETLSKVSAYHTLGEVLEVLLRLLAPVMPFLTEALYEELPVPGDYEKLSTIHSTKYPEINKEMLNPKLENDFQLVREIINTTRGLRNAVNIKNRQPLAKLTIVSRENLKNILNSYKKIIREELNVKEILFQKDEGNLLRLFLNPQYKLLGPRYKNESQR